MKTRRSFLVLLFFLGTATALSEMCFSKIYAQEEGDSESESEADTDDVDAGEPVEVKPPPRAKKKGGPREKNVQGTRALRSFEPETVIKSRYKSKGQPLDVDPD